MRILIYGAGVIGSTYAVRLSKSGCDVSVLARGRRLEQLRRQGIQYRAGAHILREPVRVLSRLEPGDRYDYIFLTVRAEQLTEALQQLRDNVSPTIVTMVNSLDRYTDWEAICGTGRILPGFPGSGGSIQDGVLDAGLTPALIQPTTFAEIDGARTARVDALKRVLARAGIPCQIVPDMHAWQVCHLAMVVPLADAYYLTADPGLVHRDKAVMRRTARALQENFAGLKARGDAISPPKMNLFRLCPPALTAWVLPFVYNSSFGDRFMRRHALTAREEMAQLHRAFYGYMEGKDL